MTDPFKFDKLPLRYAVIGNPVAHSKSPEIHQAFALQCGIVLKYEAVQVDPGGLLQALRNLQARSFGGLNVTVPYKQEVHTLVDRLSERARVAAAVNTLVFGPNETMFGDNTDGVGLVSDLERNLRRVVRGTRILVIGAGGAVRGILESLLSADPMELVLANRTAERAVSLAAAFAEYGSICALPLDQLAGQKFDLVINGTAASLVGQIPRLPNNLFTSDALAYDMAYADRPTPFMRWAINHGAENTVDGLGMLVEQAARSFELWHGVRPQTAPVLQSLRASE